MKAILLAWRLVCAFRTGWGGAGIVWPYGYDWPEIYAWKSGRIARLGHNVDLLMIGRNH